MAKNSKGLYNVQPADSRQGTHHCEDKKGYSENHPDVCWKNLDEFRLRGILQYD